MKKALLYLAGLSLAIMILGSCEYFSSIPTTVQTPETTNNASTNTSPTSELPKPTYIPSIPTPSEPEPSVPASSEPTRLSVDEAFAIYSSWLENHEELSSHTLDKESHELFELNGESYYLFHSDEMIRYWYNILVHMETGELLFMMTSDGEYPSTSVEPLEDWFNSFYAE